jgi:hypothetical protein
MHAYCVFGARPNAGAGALFATQNGARAACEFDVMQCAHVMPPVGCVALCANRIFSRSLRVTISML